MARLTTPKTFNNGQWKGNFFIHSSGGKEYCHGRVMPGLGEDIQTTELGVGRGNETRLSNQQSHQHNSSCEQHSTSLYHPFMRDPSGVEHWIDTGRSPSSLNVQNIPYRCKYISPSERSAGQADVDEMLLNNLLNDSGENVEYTSSVTKPMHKIFTNIDDGFTEKNLDRSTKILERRRNKFFIDCTETDKSHDVCHAKQKHTVTSKKLCTNNNDCTNISSVSNLPTTNHDKNQQILEKSQEKSKESLWQVVIEKSSNSSSSVCKNQEEISKKGLKRNRKDPSARSKGKLRKALNTEDSEQLEIKIGNNRTTRKVPVNKDSTQHCQRFESGDYDDDSDSVLTANYIRSTKVRKSNNSRQSKSFLRSVRVMDREASTKSLILHANKSTVTNTHFTPNCSSLQSQSPDVGPASRTRAALFKKLHYKNEKVLVKAGLLKYTCSEDVRHVASQNSDHCLNVHPDSNEKCKNYKKISSPPGHNKNQVNLISNSRPLETKEHSATEDTSSSVIVVRKTHSIAKSKESPNTNNVIVKKEKKHSQEQAMCSVGCITDDTILINEKIMQATFEVQNQDIDNLIGITKSALQSMKRNSTANSNENCPRWTKNDGDDNLPLHHQPKPENKNRRGKSYALRYAASDDTKSFESNYKCGRPHGKDWGNHTTPHKHKNTFFK